MRATEAELRRVLAEAAFCAGYGFELGSVADGECTLEVPFRPAIERPGGIVAGAVFMAAADAAMWLAVLTRLGPQDRAVTAEMTTAFLGAAREEGFRCRARVLKWGRRLVYGVAECVSDGGRLLTHHTITYIRTEEGPRLVESS
ncbi:MAG TPA: PaaI family thioesterase [Candidatus Rokubacteria bacterium]|nr:MAG: hypothetical protein A2X53_17330 [Candidatus Rokubacteria bacterium GWA2_70_23]OGK93426.1 MAG: hypothetical protein A2X50_02785 [Candidatus Rokubacteria bacterium GWF2_70_14]HAM58621.1 PaaI family thioesterase [Candidatus Rokubacteria bacterium]